jgi:hypothetical protein
LAKLVVGALAMTVAKGMVYLPIGNECEFVDQMNGDAIKEPVAQRCGYLGLRSPSSSDATVCQDVLAPSGEQTCLIGEHATAERTLGRSGFRETE